MRNVIKISGLLLVIGLFLIACQPAAAPEPAPAAEEPAAEEEAPAAEEAPAVKEAKDMKVIYVGVDSVSPYQKVNMAGIEAKAAELGITDVKYMNPPENTDLERQLELMDAAILEKPDMILLVPVDSAAIGPAVQKALDTGIAVVTIGIESVSVPPNAHVATDSVNTSYAAGETMCEALGGKGKVLMVLGNPIHAPTELRAKGFKNALAEKCPDVEIVGEQVANWSPDEAQTVVINTVTAVPDLAGVYAENDTMGQGVVAALEQLNRMDIKAVTYDCMQVMVEAARDGKIYADACQMPFYEGEVALETGIKVVQGEEVPAFVDAGTFIVKQDNAAQFLKDFEGMLP